MTNKLKVFWMAAVKALYHAGVGFVSIAALVWAVGFSIYVFEDNAPDHWWVEYDGITAFTKYEAGTQPKFFPSQNILEAVK